MSSEIRRYALGIDFGGTSTKLGLVDDHGKILAHGSFSTREATGQPQWLDAVEQVTNQLRSQKDLSGLEFAGVGVGAPGFVDFERGFIYDLPNVPGWKEVALGDVLRGRMGVPAFVDNDVNAMAVGECTFGAGRLYQHAVFLTLGTGVGGALLLNNKLYRGAYSMAGELGHVSIDLHGIQSPQGRGGLEQYIGNQRLVERCVNAIRQGKKSAISDMVKGDLTKVDPKIIEKAARNGDELGIEIYDFLADCLATALASVTYLLQPQAFIIGGGIAKSGDLVFEAVRQHLRARLSPVFAERIKVQPAELGNDAGTIGSATLALLSG